MFEEIYGVQILKYQGVTLLHSVGRDCEVIWGTLIQVYMVENDLRDIFANISFSKILWNCFVKNFMTKYLMWTVTLQQEFPFCNEISSKSRQKFETSSITHPPQNTKSFKLKSM